METQSVRKISWLAIVNVGLGVLAFLSGLIPLIGGVAWLSGWDIDSSSSLSSIINGYYDWIEKGGYPVPFIGLVSGLGTLILGLIASISIQENKQRGVAYIGSFLGMLGTLGNLITFVAVTLISSQ